jgi:hypothetical protein
MEQLIEDGWIEIETLTGEEADEQIDSSDFPEANDSGTITASVLMEDGIPVRLSVDNAQYVGSGFAEKAFARTFPNYTLDTTRWSHPDGENCVVCPVWNNLTCKVYEITAEDPQNAGEQHSWEVYELPTGEAMDPGVGIADQWYDDVDSVEAYGLDFIVDRKDMERTITFSEDQIKESVNASARAYGEAEAIPESLRRYLDDQE